MIDFKPTPAARQLDKIIQYLPIGKAWDNASDETTNMGAFLGALGVEFYRLELLIENVNRELDVNRTEQLIREWEIAVGIPDDCFLDFRGVSIEELEDRRENIRTKLNAARIQSAQDYIDFAANFGVAINVLEGGEQGTFPLPFPFIFFEGGKSAKFSIIIEFTGLQRSIFPLNFNFPFVSEINNLIICLLRKIKPANCDMAFRFID